jgi:hypothetical protein
VCAWISDYGAAHVQYVRDIPVGLRDLVWQTVDRQTDILMAGQTDRLHLQFPALSFADGLRKFYESDRS